MAKIGNMAKKVPPKAVNLTKICTFLTKFAQSSKTNQQ